MSREANGHIYIKNSKGNPTMIILMMWRFERSVMVHTIFLLLFLFCFLVFHLKTMFVVVICSRTLCCSLGSASVFPRSMLLRKKSVLPFVMICSVDKLAMLCLRTQRTFSLLPKQSTEAEAIDSLLKGWLVAVGKNIARGTEERLRVV